MTNAPGHKSGYNAAQVEEQEVLTCRCHHDASRATTIPSWPNRSRTLAALQRPPATRSILTASSPSCLPSSTRRCSRQGRPSGRDHRLTGQRVVKGEEASPNRHGLTTCMPCSFAPCRWSRSVASAQRNGLREVTVTYRCIPLLTTPYGTRVARSARTRCSHLRATAPSWPRG